LPLKLRCGKLLAYAASKAWADVLCGLLTQAVLFSLLFDKVPVYFYIHPYLGQKNTFQSYSCTFSSKFGDSILILNRNGKFWQKNITFISHKVGIYFEMVQSPPWCWK